MARPPSKWRLKGGLEAHAEPMVTVHCCTSKDHVGTDQSVMCVKPREER